MQATRRTIGSHITYLQGETEQVFFNRPLVVVTGAQHDESLPRYDALGHTDADRLLCIVFAIRAALLRVTSVRPMSRRERRVYEHAKEEAAATDTAL